MVLISKKVYSSANNKVFMTMINIILFIILTVIGNVLTWHAGNSKSNSTLFTISGDINDIDIDHGNNKWSGLLAKSNLINTADTVNYFVDIDHGNNEWSGLLAEPNLEHTDGPVKTIQKAYAKITTSGSTIYVKKGTYRETLYLSKNYQIKIQPFPSNEGEVIINGADIIPEDQWQRCTIKKCPKIKQNRNLQNIYYVDLSFDTTQIFQNGARLPRSRYPNEGYLFPTAITNNARSEFIDNNLTQPDHYFEGAICHIRTADWTIAQLKVIKHVNNYIRLAGQARYNISTGSGYYFTNIPAEINQPRQWAFDNSRKRLYFYPNGSLKNIEASRRDYGITTNAARASKHEIIGIIIRNVSKYGIWLYNSDNMIVRENTIEYPYIFGVKVEKASNTDIIDNIIKYAAIPGQNLIIF